MGGCNEPQIKEQSFFPYNSSLPSTVLLAPTQNQRSVLRLPNHITRCTLSKCQKYLYAAGYHTYIIKYDLENRSVIQKSKAKTDCRFLQQDSQGNIWVLDNFSNSLMKLTEDLEFSERFPQVSSYSAALIDNCYMDIMLMNRAGSLIYCFEKSNQMSIFDTFSHKFAPQIPHLPMKNEKLTAFSIQEDKKIAALAYQTEFVLVDLINNKDYQSSISDSVCKFFS